MLELSPRACHERGGRIKGWVCRCGAPCCVSGSWSLPGQQVKQVCKAYVQQFPTPNTSGQTHALLAAVKSSLQHLCCVVCIVQDVGSQ